MRCPPIASRSRKPNADRNQALAATTSGQLSTGITADGGIDRLSSIRTSWRTRRRRCAGSARLGPVEITHPEQELFDGAGATKRDLVDYLAAVADRILPELAGRPLSVIRVRPGQDPFMQKNLPKYAPGWIRTTKVWAERSRRELTYALCDDERTLLWFGNQRAVEYHPTLMRYDLPDPPITMVMDLDPPEGAGFGVVTAAAQLVRRALDDAGMAGAVKTSGSKGVHVIIPVAGGTPPRPRPAACRRPPG